MERGVIALDTNVLVRFLVADDKAQSARAERIIEGALTSGEGIFITDVVLCETVWVLAFTYKMDRLEVGRLLEEILATTDITIRGADSARRALAAFLTSKGGFADYLIRDHASLAGCSTVATFDKALLKEPGFTAP
jgi:predicted nucleic-acid-binding protein